jgi:hypothetical protein
MMHVNQVTSDIDKAAEANDGGKSLDNIKDNLSPKSKDRGWYSDLSPKQRDEMLRKVDAYKTKVIAKDELQKKRAYRFDMQDVTERVLSQNYTQTDLLSDIGKNKFINPSTGKLDVGAVKLLDSLISAPKVAKSDTKAYNEVLNMLETKKGMKKDETLDYAVMMRTMQLVTDKRLTKDEARDLMQIPAIKNKEDPGKLITYEDMISAEEKHSKEVTAKMNKFQQGWTAIKKAIGFGPKSDHTVEMAKKFIQYLNDPSEAKPDPNQKILEIIRKQRLEALPSLADADEKEGQDYTDAYGNVTTGYPNGDLEEKQEQPKDEPEERDTAN